MYGQPPDHNPSQNLTEFVQKLINFAIAKEKGGWRDAHSKDKHFLNSEDVFKHTYVDVSTCYL